MQLKIISLKGTVYDGKAKGINVKTGAGEITVLDHHLPIISSLMKGKAVIFTDAGLSAQAGRKEIEISGGFLEMDGNNCLTLLVD